MLGIGHDVHRKVGLRGWKVGGTDALLSTAHLITDQSSFSTVVFSRSCESVCAVHGQAGLLQTHRLAEQLQWTQRLEAR